MTLLQILFITLKLTAVINWSWWWVLSPTLIPLGITIVIAVPLLLICGVGYVIQNRKKKRK